MDTTRCALEGRRTAATMDVNRPLDSTDSTAHILSSEYFFHAGVNVRVNLIVGRHGRCGSGSTLVTARRTAAVATSVADDAVTASTAVQPPPQWDPTCTGTPHHESSGTGHCNGSCTSHASCSSNITIALTTPHSTPAKGAGDPLALSPRGGRQAEASQAR
jgi:hypothetical protein